MDNSVGKVLIGSIGAVLSVCIAVVGWTHSVSERLASQERSLATVEKVVDNLSLQTQMHDKQLTTLAHKLDIRITLLESLIEKKYKQEALNGD